MPGPDSVGSGDAAVGRFQENLPLAPDKGVATPQSPTGAKGTQDVSETVRYEDLTPGEKARFDRTIRVINNSYSDNPQLAEPDYVPGEKDLRVLQKLVTGNEDNYPHLAWLISNFDEFRSSLTENGQFVVDSYGQLAAEGFTSAQDAVGSAYTEYSVGLWLAGNLMTEARIQGYLNARVMSDASKAENETYKRQRLLQLEALAGILHSIGERAKIESKFISDSSLIKMSTGLVSAGAKMVPTLYGTTNSKLLGGNINFTKRQHQIAFEKFSHKADAASGLATTFGDGITKQMEAQLKTAMAGQEQVQQVAKDTYDSLKTSLDMTLRRWTSEFREKGNEIVSTLDRMSQGQVQAFGFNVRG